MKRVHESRDIVWLRRMFYQNELPAVDLAIDPMEFVTPDSGVKEGSDDEECEVESENESENENELERIDDDDGGGKATLQEAVTRSGRVSYKPARYIEEIGAVAGDYEIGLSVAEIRYYDSMCSFPLGEFAPGELACVGAGLGGGFENTKELHVMKYKQAMATSDSKNWELAVKAEHDRMVEAEA
jgi:hypothetical protein